MLELNSNPAVTAKVRAMYGRRISDEQYDELMKRRSVSEIAGYLKSNTHFSAALANINESNIHRGQLEDVLRREVFNSYSRLYRYTNVRGENLFHYVIMEEEIGEILRMVQLLNAGNPQDYIVELPGYLIQGADIPLVELAKVDVYKRQDEYGTDKGSLFNNRLICSWICEYHCQQFIRV